MRDSPCELRDLVEQTGAFDPHQAVHVQTHVAEGASAAEIAIVMPVFNQASTIAAVLDALRACLTLPHEICLVLDGCSDGTEQVVKAWAAAAAAAAGETTRIVIAQLDSSVFETVSDAIGIALTEAPIVIEVQADMTLQQPGFDACMRMALERVPQLLLLGGRGAHTFAAAVGTSSGPLARRLAALRERLLNWYFERRGAYSPTRIEHLATDRIGRTGSRVEVPSRADAGFVWIQQTAMRGPLAFVRERYERVGGLDTRRFFLGHDDHDLALRGFEDAGFVSGYIPISFSSPLALGATRRERSEQEQAEFDRLRNYYADRFRESRLGRAADRESFPRAARPRIRI